MKSTRIQCMRYIYGRQCTKTAVPNTRYCEKHQRLFKHHTYAIGQTKFDGQRVSDYQKYIDSDQWKQRAKQERSFWHNHCALCHRSQKLIHVHHNTYVRLGNERQGDLIVLCNECHKLFHQFYEYDSSVGYFVPKPSLIALLRKLL